MILSGYRSYLCIELYLSVMLLMAHVRWFIIVIELIETFEWFLGAKNVMVEVPLDIPKLIFGVDTSGNGEDLVELFQGISFGFLLLG